MGGRVRIAKGGLSYDCLKKYDEIARIMQLIPEMKSKRFIYNESELTIGDKDELTPEQLELVGNCLEKLIPWKKGL